MNTISTCSMRGLIITQLFKVVILPNHTLEFISVAFKSVAVNPQNTRMFQSIAAQRSHNSSLIGIICNKN